VKEKFVVDKVKMWSGEKTVERRRHKC